MIGALGPFFWHVWLNLEIREYPANHQEPFCNQQCKLAKPADAGTEYTLWSSQPRKILSRQRWGVGCGSIKMCPRIISIVPFQMWQRLTIMAVVLFIYPTGAPEIQSHDQNCIPTPKYCHWSKADYGQKYSLNLNEQLPRIATVPHTMANQSFAQESGSFSASQFEFSTRSAVNIQIMIESVQVESTGRPIFDSWN
jgi:hypothetical protein